MVNGPATIPILQVRGNSALVYDEYIFQRRYATRHKLRSRMKQARRGQYSGKMTAGTRKRLARSATLLAQASKARWITNPVTNELQYHKLSFITLTVTQGENISAQDGHRLLLADFLQWMRRKKGVTTYIWKAELQKRGQLHYHITTPTFIHYKEIRDKWNELQMNAGMLKDWAAEHGHTDPNSTDVHEVRHVKDLARYIIKELAKSMQNEQATRGKIWDCSDNLAGVPYYSVAMCSHHERRIDELRAAGLLKIHSGERFTIIDLKDTGPPGCFSDYILLDYERTALDKYLDEILNGKKDEQIEIPFVDVPPAAADPAPGWQPIIQTELF